MRVIDGDSGHFRVVKFNLGNKSELMAPFIHTFIKDLSNTQVSKLFLAGAHASIYIAHYEVIVHAGMSFFTALVMIIIIIVIIYIAWPMIAEGFAALGTNLAALGAAVGTGTFLSVAWGIFLANLPTMLIKMAAQYIIQLIITEIAGDNPELAMILNLVAMVAVAAWDPYPTGVAVPGTYGHTGGAVIGQGGGSLTTSSGFQLPAMNVNFSDLNAWDYVEIAAKALGSFGDMLSYKAASIAEELALDYAKLEAVQSEFAREQAGWTVLGLDSPYPDFDPFTLTRAKQAKLGDAATVYAISDAYPVIQLACFEYSLTIESKCSVDQMIGYG